MSDQPERAGTIRVAAPATTANLGPGYDCLGMALDIWNTIEVELQPDGTPPSVGSRAREPVSWRTALRTWSTVHGVPLPGAGSSIPEVRVNCANEIPLARGLGSSAAAIAGGLAAANALSAGSSIPGTCWRWLPPSRGIPTMWAPRSWAGCNWWDRRKHAIYGAGLRASLHSPVLFIPETRIATADARAVLPQELRVRTRCTIWQGLPCWCGDGHESPRVLGRGPPRTGCTSPTGSHCSGHEAADEGARTPVHWGHSCPAADPRPCPDRWTRR